MKNKTKQFVDAILVHQIPQNIKNNLNNLEFMLSRTTFSQYTGVLDWIFNITDDIIDYNVLDDIMEDYHNVPILQQIDVGCNSVKIYRYTRKSLTKKALLDQVDVNQVNINRLYPSMIISLWASKEIDIPNKYVAILYMLIQSRPIIKKMSLKINALCYYDRMFKILINRFYGEFKRFSNKNCIHKVTSTSKNMVEHMVEQLIKHSCDILVVSVDTIYYIGDFTLNADDYKPFIVETEINKKLEFNERNMKKYKLIWGLEFDKHDMKKLNNKNK